MRKFEVILKAAALMVIFATVYSCSGGSKAEPEVMSAKLTADRQQVSSDKGSIFLSVAASGSWTLSLSYSGTESGWASLSVTSGSGSKNSVILSYNANSSSSPRTLTVTLNAGSLTSTVSFTQQGYTPSGGSGGEDERIAIPSWLELPGVPDDDEFKFISHNMTLNGKKQRNYSYWWDYSNLVARWVAYPLNSTLIGSGKRSDAWALDPLLSEKQQPVLYKGYSDGNDGWYARGHQIASADRLTPGINESTFYGTNMTPQNNDFNSGIWAVLEGQVRSWSKNSDTLYVVTGCTVEGSTKYCYDNKGKKVTVPTGYFKALLRYKENSTIGYGGFIGCGFYFDHANKYGSSVKKSMMMSIDDLEKKLGIDFFVNLPSDIENSVEKQDPKTVSWWGLND
ncbi:MAG: DNA/RNA non-specific endonuclease [Bacteroidales bacterium]|nr:DNA/RNA non-specific endonuclease [Bacteroidales bacterium]